MAWLSREEVRDADARDPLREARELFLTNSSGTIYLDGNSLGRPTRSSAGAIARLVDEWSTDLVQGWDRWADLPVLVGDKIGRLLGAAAGQVVVADSTTVNLYKLASAAMDARTGRRVIVGDANDFPTVRYVLQGLAERGGHRLRLLAGSPSEGLNAQELSDTLLTMGEDVALCCMSMVNYRSGAVADVAPINCSAHQIGALTLWDLSHAAGCLPVELDASGTDLAVGCGYKYLNGGPGAPAWLYVATALQAQLRQPIWGWWGQRDQFGMGPVYDPVPGTGRFLSGTPPVLGLAALEAGIEPLLRVGIGPLWEKAQALVSLLAAGVEELLVPLGARMAGPSSPDRRGGHLAVSHRQAWEAARLLVQRDLVVPDFRAPDVLRLAPVPIYTSYSEVHEAVSRIASVLADEELLRPVPKARIT